MYVGPFIYLNHPRVSHKGVLADPLPHEKAVHESGRLISQMTHESLLATIAPEMDFMELPRGQVVFDEESKTTIIYLDRCVEPYVDDVVRLFGLSEWVVEYDDDYVCPRCDHLADRF